MSIQSETNPRACKILLRLGTLCLSVYLYLSIGGYTNLTTIDPAAFPNWVPLAASGGLGPTSSTSLLWEVSVTPSTSVRAGGNVVGGIHDICGGGGRRNHESGLAGSCA